MSSLPFRYYKIVLLGFCSVSSSSSVCPACVIPLIFMMSVSTYVLENPLHDLGLNTDD